MKCVSWNVNGLRACMKKGFMDFFQEVDADIFAIQETKMQLEQLEETMKPQGYHLYMNSAEKKGILVLWYIQKKNQSNVFMGLKVMIQKKAESLHLNMKISTLYVRMFQIQKMA